MLSDIERQRLQDRVLGLVSKWVGIMGMESWRIHHRWEEAPEASHGASNSAQWENLMMDVTWNLSALHERQEEIELYVVHELCHAMLDEITPEESNKPEERVVAQLTAAFLRAAGGSGG